MNQFYKVLLSVMLLIPAVLFTSCGNKGNGVDSNITFGVGKTSYSNLAKEAQVQVLTVSSAASWNLTSNQSWIRPGSTGGNAGRSIKINLDIDENTADGARQARLSFSSPSINKSLTITVSQLGKSGEPMIGDAAVEWIYNELKDNYYWNDEVLAASPDFNLEYDDFLDELLLDLDKAYDTEASGKKTIDGYYRDGVRYLYSWVDRTAGTRAASNDTYTTFGFDFIATRVTGQTGTHIEGIITNILPGGPAEAAELKRGMRITKYDGSVMQYDDYVEFWNAVYQLASRSIKMTVGGKEITLNAKSALVNPIYDSKIIDVQKNGTTVKVGYLLYNEFERGSGWRFDLELCDIFAEFSSKGVQKLVLDLRYNRGGYVTSSQILTSLITNGGSAAFAKLLYPVNSGLIGGKSNPEVWDYLTTSTIPKSYNSSLYITSLNLGKGDVYVLGTFDTASASEMVISSLKGIGRDAILIGKATNGKNVGMNGMEETIDGYTYEFYPITFKCLNDQDFCDYPEGFTPDKEIDELGEWFTGTVYELGDEKEVLLKAALDHIKTGSFGTRSEALSDTGILPIKPPFSPKRGGAIIPPGESGRLAD